MAVVYARDPETVPHKGGARGAAEPEPTVFGGPQLVGLEIFSQFRLIYTTIRIVLGLGRYSVTQHPGPH